MSKSDLTRRHSHKTDKWFLDQLEAAADWMVLNGCPDPALPSFVRLAALELECYYAADLITDLSPFAQDEELDHDHDPGPT